MRKWNFTFVGIVILGVWLISGCMRSQRTDAMNVQKERWQITTKGYFFWYGLLALQPIYREQISSVLMESGHVYVAVDIPGGNARYLSIDRQTGNIVWNHKVEFGRPAGDQLVRVGNRVVASLYTLHKDDSTDITIVAMNATDGKIIWRSTLSNYKSAYGQMLEVNPEGETLTVYIPGVKKRNHIVLRVSDGQIISESSYNGYMFAAGARRAPGLIFGFDGRAGSVAEYKRLLAFSKETGQVVWELPLSRQGVSFPTVVDNSLLISNKDKLLRLNASSGKPYWTVELRGRTVSDMAPPLVMGSSVMVSHYDGDNFESQQWKLGIFNFADGTNEAEIPLEWQPFETFSMVKPFGQMVIVASNYVVHIVDPKKATVVATLDFYDQFSLFVYADPPAMSVVDSDSQGFVVTTTDGRLQYYSAKDFKISKAGTSSITVGRRTSSGSARYLSILYYLVVNPFWDALQFGQRGFRLLFYGFPFVLFCLVMTKRPLWSWLQRLGVLRGARWGAQVGGVLALPAAISIGLLGGMAADAGRYGFLGVFWGGMVGIGFFLGIGVLLGGIVGSFFSYAGAKVGKQ